MSSSFQPYTLSQREIEVIQPIADGLTDKEIAARLCITRRTVSEHISNIRSKLGASNRASAVYLYFFNLMARRNSIVTAPHRRDMTTTNSADVSIRSADAGRDVDAIASLQFPEDLVMAGCEFLTPVTMDGVKDDVTRALADANHNFFVAQDASGVVGFSQLSRYAWNPPDKRDMRIVVAPAHRSRGIDDALYAGVVAHCAEHKVFHLATSILDNDPDALRAACKRGFIEAHHQINFELDLTTFDVSRFDGLFERVQASGIRISNLAEIGNTEEA